MSDQELFCLSADPSGAPPALPEEVLHALKRLAEAGHQALLAGGCVRDLLMGGDPESWDAVTSATPEEIKALFPGEKPEESGEAPGTVTLTRRSAVLRIACLCAGARKEDFTGLLEAFLRRRAFTVDAMAWAPGGPVTDPFGGLEDLKNGLIRTVGDPETRFGEDPLLPLRALRLASGLAFVPEAAAAAALQQHKDGIARLDGARIFEEMTGILMGKDLLRVGLEYAGLLFAAVPELAPMKGCPQECIYHSWDVWEHSLRTAALCPPDPLVRWAGLLHDVGKPSCRTRDQNGNDHFFGHPAKGAVIADRVCAALKMSGEWRREIHMLVLRHDEPFFPGDIQILLSQIGPDSARKLILLHMADQGAHAPMIAQRAHRGEELLDEIDRLEHSDACWRLDQLSVNERDMETLGFSGPAVKEILNYLLQAVIRFHVPNDHDLLLQAAKAHLESAVTAFISKTGKTGSAT